ncbi:unnamed protein product [Pylaiella littoralis]
MDGLTKTAQQCNQHAASRVQFVPQKRLTTTTAVSITLLHTTIFRLAKNSDSSVHLYIHLYHLVPKQNHHRQACQPPVDHTPVVCYRHKPSRGCHFRKLSYLQVWSVHK